MNKIIIVCIAALALVYISTLQSIGIGPDSTVYIGVARNIMGGRGLLLPVLDIPMTHFPPLYSYLLALSKIAGLPIIVWARWLNLLLLVANLIMAVLISFRTSPKNHLLTILLIAFSRSFIEIHVMAWSESVYIFFTFASFLLLALYLIKQRFYLLLLCGMLAGLAWFDRYIGIATIAALSVGLWIFSRQKVKDILVFCAVSITPMIVFLTSNVLNSGNLVNRIIKLNSIQSVEAGILIGVLLCSLAAHRAMLGKQSNPLLHILALFLFFYTVVLAITVCLLDADTLVLDFRMLSPIFYTGFLLIVPFMVLYSRRQRIIQTMLIVIIVLQIAYAVMFAQGAATAGLIQATGEWHIGDLYIPPHQWQ